MTDEQFFTTYPTRRARIRKPAMALAQGPNHAVAYQDECEKEFRTLGDHKQERRRVLLWRVPEDNPYYDPRKPPILKIPFLLFSDETVEDDDATLLPLIHEIMQGAAR